MTNKPMACQRILAGFDRNGNSQNLWLIYDEGGNAVAVLDEYYNKPEECRALVELPNMRVTKSEYRDWVAFGKALRKKKGE